MGYDLLIFGTGFSVGACLVVLICFLRLPATVSSGRFRHHDTCKDCDMPSQGFTEALTGLIAAFDARQEKAVADALANQPPPVTDTGPTVDADDTAALVAATPAAS